MALKDMKSDLSKFRMPKKEPLKSKENPGINKNLNKTPLSSMAESAPKIPRSTTTVNKEGVNPQKINQTEKFKGETSPQPMDNSEKFKGETAPKPMSLEERYLGQTDPKLVNQTEKFKGETNPKEMDNQSKFLGETNPTDAKNQTQFLGETSPTEMDNKSQFLGETNPKEANNQSQFLGETNPKEANNKIQFLGETSPTEMKNQSQFLGETTPNEMSEQSGERFLGETTPNESDRSSKFLGETTPNEANNQSQFLGETTPNEMDKQSGEKFLGETTTKESDRGSKFLGETTPLPSEITSKFLGETDTQNISQGDRFKGETTPNSFPLNSKLDTTGKSPKEVNNLLDIHATGFNSKFGVGEHTKFVGVNKNNTVFEGASSIFGDAKTVKFSGETTKFDRSTSLYGNFDNTIVGLSFTPGYGSFKRKTETGPTQRYNPDTKYRVSAELTNKSISQLQEMRSSPSFLDEMYSKYNLKDDAHNAGLGLFRQPFILRGIQRRKVSKGEPQKWGIGGFTYDEGAIRGGIVTSTVRALVDVARIGSWFASIPGILWGVKQFGLQRTQKFGKIWTPINMLAAIGGQHIGLKPMRAGLIPLNDPTTKYGNIVGGLDIASTAGGKIGQKLRDIAAGIVDYQDLSKIWDLEKLNKEGNTEIWKSDKKGGFNSLYGINITGPSEHKRFVNTFKNAAKTEAHKNTKDVTGEGEFSTKFDVDTQYNPISSDPSTSPTHESKVKTPFEKNETNLAKKAIGSGTVDSATGYGDFLKDNPNNTDGENHPIEKLGTSDTVKHYETMAYGAIPTRGAKDTQYQDFRSKLTGVEKEISEKENYKENNISKTYFGGQDPSTGTLKDRKDWTGTSTSDNKRWDVINALGAVSSESELKDDLVPFYIQPLAGEDGKFYQFRGTITGLTETFSPSWDSIKFSGRADQGYKYGTFERSVAFNFQVYATSRIDMKPMYEKLQALSTFTMPEYVGSKGYQGILVKMTLGDLYKNKLSFIDSLTYSVSDDLPWDTNSDSSDLGVMPMGIDVAIGFKILDEVRPQYLQKVYDLKWEQ